MSRIIGYHDDPLHGCRPILMDHDYKDLERLHGFYQQDAQVYFAAKLFPEELLTSSEKDRLLFLEKELRETEDEYLGDLAEYLGLLHEPTRERMTCRYDPEELNSHDYNRAVFLSRLSNTWIETFAGLLSLAGVWLVLDFLGSFELTGLFWGLVLLLVYLGIVGASLKHYAFQERQAFRHNIYHEKSKAYQHQDVFHWAVKASNTKSSQ